MKHTLEGLEKLRQSKLGNKNPMFGKPAWNRGLPMNLNAKKALEKANRGRVFTLEERFKRSERVKGEKHWNWKGGISSKNQTDRMCLEYKLWREAVFASKGVYLEADHIKPFCDYPELRFAIDNGRTLCRACHSKTDTYKGRSNKGKKYKTRDIAQLPKDNSQE